MGTFGDSWELTKLSFSVLRKDKEILLLPLISGICMILIWGTMLGSLLGLYILYPAWFDALLRWPNVLGLGIGLFFLYVFTYFIIIFFNAAVIACAMIRLKGGDPTVKDGLRKASRYMGKIFLWALVSATIGLILQAISQRAGLAGRIATWIVGVAWSVATYFIVPVLIYEELGAWASLKKSAKTFKDAFGRAVVSNLALGLIILGLGLIGLIPFIVGLWIFVTSGSLVIFLICLAIAFIYWAVIACVSSAVQGVLIAALYRYATTGKISPDFAPASAVFPAYISTLDSSWKRQD